MRLIDSVIWNISEDELTASYNQLRFIDQKAWPLTLQKLSTNVEWKCIAYLIFGPKLDQRLFTASPRGGSVYLDNTTLFFLCPHINLLGGGDTVLPLSVCQSIYVYVCLSVFHKLNLQNLTFPCNSKLFNSFPNTNFRLLQTETVCRQEL